jgi:uncharacterized protein YbjQ (UPF0145 family)
MGEWINLIITAVILIVAFTAGKIEQNIHYSSIKKREDQHSYRNILLFNEKIPPPEYAGQRFELVCGSVVMGSDYFRQFIASLKALFGGRLTSFEAMLDRGRREAILRMKAEAESMGANVIFNVRLETSTLSMKKSGSGGLACMEIVAYGTAWRAPNTGKTHAR